MREIAEAEVAMLGEIFHRFVEKSPIAVMVRGVLERVLVCLATSFARK
jgi:hypothetical protein